MSYLENRKNNNRAVTGIAAVAIEAIVILGIVKGLAVTFSPPDRPPVTVATDVPTAPLPPPPPEDRAMEQERTIKSDQPDDTVTVTENPLATDTTVVGPVTTPTPLPTDVVVVEPQPTATPDPQPSYSPRGAIARGRPETWATANDYPSRDLVEGNQGITRFRLAIGVDGRVISCTVISSSGHPGLDSATCAKVSARARFNPATDGFGAKVTGTYVNAIRWEIPE